MRYLIGALCAIALLFSSAPSVAAAATVGCGRVTAFVGPNAVGSLITGDGWVIFAKPDGNSDKVILRAGTQVGTLSGYVCVGIDGVYFTGLIAPGGAGYITEPKDWVTPGTAVYCGTVAANSITFGQGSGPRTYELRVTSGPGGGGRFSVPESIALPPIGSYLCGRFAQGAPMNGLLAVLRSGDPGYVGAGLPNTSTGDVVNVCGQLNAYQAASGTRNAVLSLDLSTDPTRLELVGGFQLVGTGTVPANLGQDHTLPELLRLTGRGVEGVNAVADYNVVRVSSCGALPNTSTDPGSPWLPSLLIGLASLAAAGLLVSRSRRSSAAH